MIPAPLWKLLWLRVRGFVRRMTRGLYSVKGVIFGVAGIALVGMWFVSFLPALIMTPRSDPERVREFFAPVMLLLTVSMAFGGAGGKAIRFSPPEVDMLFPGPFSRRQLLRYKIVVSALGTLLTALVMSLVLLRHARSWPAAFLGSYLTFLFIQQFSMIVAILRTTAARAAMRGRARVVLLSIAVIVVAAIVWGVRSVPTDDFPRTLAAIRDSPITHVILAPFDVFARIFTAPIAGWTLLLWALAGIAMNVGLTLIILRLDAAFLEIEVGVGRERHDRLQERMRRGWAGPVRGRWLRLPRLPRLGGIGSIARRQMITAARRSWGLIIVLLGVAVAGGFVVRNVDDVDMLLPVTIGVMIYASILMTAMVRFDFRTELDHIEWLKSLPIPGWRVTVGELVVPVLLITFVQSVAAAGLLLMVPNAPWALVLVPVFALVVNLAWIAMENAFFLLYPVRNPVVGVADFTSLGRNVVLWLGRTAAMVVAFAVSAVLAAIAYFVGGQSWPAALVTGWIALGLVGMAAVAGCTLCFARFDVARDRPGES